MGGALSRFIDLIWAGILWLITSLPVVTIGPASAALYYTVAKCVRHDRGRLTPTFFSAFRSNFKQGLGVWLLYLLYIVVGLADMYALRLMGVQPGSVMDHVSKLFFLPALLTLPWAFAFLSRFENTIAGSLKFVGYLTLKHFGRSILLAAELLLCVLIAWLIPPIALLLPGPVCLLMTSAVEPVFKGLSEQGEDSNPDRWYNE